MSTSNPDRIIDEWLRHDLDAVPEPTRAVRDAIDAASVTPQWRGRLFWLRQLFGLDASITEHGRPDRPEVVLVASGRSRDSSSSGALPRGGVVSPGLALAALLTAVLIVAASTWITVGPGRELMGGSTPEDVSTPEQPLRPLDPPGPDRVIVVAPVDGHFTTVTGAIAAAEPGDRIELHPGTYQAEVTITEDITVVGVGDREAIIVEPLPLAEGEDVHDRLRKVFTLRDSDATLQGFTVRGSSNGTAVVVQGGSPRLLDLVVDPAGDMSMGTPTSPREAIEIGGGATATVQDSLLTSLTSVIDGASPLLERLTFEGGCLFVEDPGTAPTIRDTSFLQSECPGFSISVARGASAKVEANHIYSANGTAGIRVANDGTKVEISGTDIRGGREGILVSAGAEADIQRSQVGDADVGVRILDADASLAINRLIGNGSGLEVSGDSYLETLENDICQNDLNLDLRDGALVPLAQNRVCVEGSSELAAESGA